MKHGFLRSIRILDPLAVTVPDPLPGLKAAAMFLVFMAAAVPLFLVAIGVVYWRFAVAVWEISLVGLSALARRAAALLAR